MWTRRVPLNRTLYGFLQVVSWYLWETTQRFFQETTLSRGIRDVLVAATDRVVPSQGYFEGDGDLRKRNGIHYKVRCPPRRWLRPAGLAIEASCSASCLAPRPVSLALPKARCVGAAPHSRRLPLTARAGRQGQFSRSARHGRGKLTWPSNPAAIPAYEGEFYRDRKHGAGVESLPGLPHKDVSYRHGVLIASETALLSSVKVPITSLQQRAEQMQERARQLRARRAPGHAVQDNDAPAADREPHPDEHAHHAKPAADQHARYRPSRAAGRRAATPRICAHRARPRLPGLRHGRCMAVGAPEGARGAAFPVSCALRLTRLAPVRAVWCPRRLRPTRRPWQNETSLTAAWQLGTVCQPRPAPSRAGCRCICFLLTFRVRLVRHAAQPDRASREPSPCGQGRRGRRRAKT